MAEALTRRELFKTAAVVGGAGVVTSEAGCAGSPLGALGARPDALAEELDPAAADAVLTSLDARLSWIDRQDLPEDLVAVSRFEGDPARAEELSRCRALVRKTARSLYATGRFIDLPDELKAHPDVQAKLRSLHGDMDDAVLGMTEVLERMSPGDHRAVQRCLREDPKLTERLASFLDRPASEDGIPFKRRFAMRASAMQLGSRMAAQSPALITEPLVRKVRRIEARPRPEAEQLRLLSARVGEEAFWRHQEKMAALHAAWAVRLGRSAATGIAAAQGGGPETVPAGSALRTGDEATVPAEPGAAPASAQPTGPTQPAPARTAPQPSATYAETPRPEPAEAPGSGTISTGATIMGFGAGSVVLGLGFWGLAEATGAGALIYPALFFGVTLGPILLLVGLVTLLVGLAIKAAA